MSQRALIGDTDLEGTCSDVYPNIIQDEAGLQKSFLQFSLPARMPSRVSPGFSGRFTRVENSRTGSATRSAQSSTMLRRPSVGSLSPGAQTPATLRATILRLRADSFGATGGGCE